MDIAPFDKQRDLPAVKRIWNEVGWIGPDDETHLEDFIDESDCVVFRVEGEAECAVLCADGDLRFAQSLDTHQDLSMCAVTGVTTSRVARKLGAAKRLTARSLAKHGEAGMDVSVLGMFDQGFYDKVGFGTGSYQHQFEFDPSKLRIDRDFRPPKRLTGDDWQAVHIAMCSRMRGHGGSVLSPAGMVKAEMKWTEKPIGLGYFDGPDGELSHFFWGEAKGEHGPYSLNFVAYQNADQLFELLALMKSLGDQVGLMRMAEPPEIQFQDLLEQPFRNGRLTKGSNFAARHNTVAYWQMRILNLESCLAKTQLQAEAVRFNLEIEDPAVEFLDGTHNWAGVSGNYVVTLGNQSAAEPGSSANLPTLKTTVGAFSRMWFGVRPASSLALTDHFEAPPQLLGDLDLAVRLPHANLGWDF